jgi:hypothetical protein
MAVSVANGFEYEAEAKQRVGAEEFVHELAVGEKETGPSYCYDDPVS